MSMMLCLTSLKKGQQMLHCMSRRLFIEPALMGNFSGLRPKDDDSGYEADIRK